MAVAEAAGRGRSQGRVVSRMDSQPREHSDVTPVERMPISPPGDVVRRCGLTVTNHESLDEERSETAGCNAAFAPWCEPGGRIGIEGSAVRSGPVASPASI